MTRVAILGMGAMGSRMARSLAAAGHSVCIWNRTIEKTSDLVGGRIFVATSPARAAEVSDYVIAMVRDDEASRQVWLNPERGALAAMNSNAVAIECSTLSPAWSAELAARCAAASRRFMDAPVLGSRPQAEAGSLIFLAGGEASLVDQCKPLLLDMGTIVHHAGPNGSGTLLKLMANGLFGIQVAALAEIIGILERHGADPRRAVEILASTPVCSTAAARAATAMVEGDFAPLFPTALVEKDFGYLTTTAGRADLAPMSNMARTVLDKAMEWGMADENLTAIVRLYRDGTRRQVH